MDDAAGTVLDLRPARERLLAALWRRGDRSGSGDGPVTRPADAIADAVVARRVRGRSAPPAGLFVVSVGNLRVGGTGKTPVVARLAADLAAAGLRGAVLTRGWGARDPGPRPVAADDAAAGDEARWLAARLRSRGWTVVQAARRDAALADLAGARDGDVVILEDGHQTARVGRHVDVLILDRWEWAGGQIVPRTGPVLPWGPYRETARGARRAAVWLLEGEPPAAPLCAATVCGFARALRLDAPDVAPERIGLLSGLARPEGFERDCARVLGAPAGLAVRGSDHCRWEGGALRRALAAGRAHGVRAWITTEKDWVKLAAAWPADVPVRVACQVVAWNTEPALPEVILRERRRWEAGRGASRR